MRLRRLGQRVEDKIWTIETFSWICGFQSDNKVVKARQGPVRLGKAWHRMAWIGKVGHQGIPFRWPFPYLALTNDAQRGINPAIWSNKVLARNVVWDYLYRYFTLISRVCVWEIPKTYAEYTGKE